MKQKCIYIYGSEIVEREINLSERNTEAEVSAANNHKRARGKSRLAAHDDFLPARSAGQNSSINRITSIALYSRYSQHSRFPRLVSFARSFTREKLERKRKIKSIPFSRLRRVSQFGEMSLACRQPKSVASRSSAAENLYFLAIKKKNETKQNCRRISKRDLPKKTFDVKHTGELVLVLGFGLGRQFLRRFLLPHQGIRLFLRHLLHLLLFLYVVL